MVPHMLPSRAMVAFSLASSETPGPTRVAGKEMIDVAVRTSWNRFCVLLAVLFAARGLFLLCFFPPLEGPDEYQHIAYLTFVHERGATPVLGRDSVPLSLYPDLVAQPHSDYDWMQTRDIGAMRYKHFPLYRPKVLSQAPIELYQAQHPPLYYWLVSPLYAVVRATFGFREAVYALRFLNIVFAAAGLGLLLHPLQRVFGDSWRGRFAALVISLLPMSLVYVCRVSNDALAILFAGLAVVVMEGVSDGRQVPLRCAAAGVLLGVGVWVKLTIFAFFPAVLLWVAALSALRWLPLRQGLLGVMALAGGYLAVAGGYHLGNLREFGTPFAAAETVHNAAAGLTWINILGNGAFEHVRSFFWERMVIGNLWTSGWTFLRPHAIWKALFKGFFALAFAGAAVGLLRRLARPGDGVTAPPVQRDAPVRGRPAVAQALQFGLVAGFSLLGAYAHALNAISAFGGIVTPSYYVIPAFPSLLTLAFIALDGYASTRFWLAGVAGLGCLFIAAEYHSLFAVALPYWSYSHDSVEIWRRAVSTHPLFPGPWSAPGLFFVLFALATIVLQQVPAASGREYLPAGTQSITER